MSTIASSRLISPDGPYFSNPDKVLEEQFINTYLKLSGSQIIDLAHQPNAMIHHCEMRGQGGVQKCEELMQGTTKIFTPKHGICYTFNSVHRNEMNKSMSVDNAGQDNGLHLDIDIEGV